MRLETSEVQSATAKLVDAREKLSNTFFPLTSVGIRSFSAVSGLDESGSMHSTIRSDNEPEATKGLAQHLANAVDLLTAQLTGYQMADNSFADVLGNVGQSVMGKSLEAVIENVSTEQPTVNNFTATNPVAGKPFSLDTLNTELIATDVASMSGMSTDWADTAATIGEALSYIPGAIADLQGSAETESIAKAIENLGQIETAGGEYMANASALSTHTASLVTVTEANALQVAAALAVARAIPNASLAKTFEETFLTAFSPKLTTELVPVTPLFTQLLPELGAPNGNGTNQSGTAGSGTPTFEDTPLPKIVQQALSNAGYRDLAYASTPSQVVEQFGRPNPDMLQSIAAGATPTQAATAAAPSMPPSLTGLTGGAGGGAGVGAGGGAGAGLPGMGQLGYLGAGAGTGLAGGAGAGAAAGIGPGGSGGFGGPAMAPLGGAGRGASGSAGGLGGALGGARGSGLSGAGGGGRLGGVAGVGAGAGAVAGPMGGFGAGSGAGMGTGAIGQGGNTFVGGGQAGNGAGARGAVAGGPGMYGAGHRGAGANSGKRGKVQAVTSAVEREGNLKALLGEAPEVVPGVIGDWVRQPRT